MPILGFLGEDVQIPRNAYVFNKEGRMNNNKAIKKEIRDIVGYGNMSS